ncbi:HD domain-containing protein [Bacillus horti]|uniref:HD domain-containing protein n=1 Tax=Caldalkalibacillus horti TaxID=77523 RepID=A0ABT9VZ64_9BACI|nr:HD domain-containing protein [Bacillus horti]MDQ0166285.1 uncharacterized protein [Bacillus horti]
MSQDISNNEALSVKEDQTIDGLDKDSSFAHAKGVSGLEELLAYFSPALVARTKQSFAGQDPAHDWAHNVRVMLVAERIGQEEQADMKILRYAALLHDIGRAEERRTGECHAEISARWAAEWLESEPAFTQLDAKEEAEQIKAIQQAILTHRFRKNNPPTTLEERILFDSDKLDSIGAIGIGRAFAYSGLIKQSIQLLPGEEGHTPTGEFQVKLVKLKDRLYTHTAKRLAEERHQFMVDFYKRFELEILGLV